MTQNSPKLTILTGKNIGMQNTNAQVGHRENIIKCPKQPKALMLQVGNSNNLDSIPQMHKDRKTQPTLISKNTR